MLTTVHRPTRRQQQLSSSHQLESSPKHFHSGMHCLTALVQVKAGVSEESSPAAEW